MGLYYILPWFDILTHFLGGIVIAFGVLALLERLHISYNTTPHSITFVSLIVAIALGWEFYEIIVNTFFPTYAFDVVDTLSDIVNDTVGALVAFFWTQKFIFSKNK